MRDGTIILSFQAIEAEIGKIKRQLGATDQEIVTLRLQMNGIVRMIKWLFPFNLLFKYFVEKEWTTYTDNLEKRRQQIEKMKEQMEASRKMAVSERQGRNAPCKCGSGKKYKKCCLNKKEVKIPSTPKDIEKAFKKAEELMNEKNKKKVE